MSEKPIDVDELETSTKVRLRERWAHSHIGVSGLARTLEGTVVTGNPNPGGFSWAPCSGFTKTTPNPSHHRGTRGRSDWAKAPNAARTLWGIGYVPHCWSALDGPSFKLKVQGLDLVRATKARIEGKIGEEQGVGDHKDEVVLAPYSLRLEGKRITPRGIGPVAGDCGGREETRTKPHTYVCPGYPGPVVGCCDDALHPDGWFTRACTTSQNEGDNETKGYVAHGLVPLRWPLAQAESRWSAAPRYSGRRYLDSSPKTNTENRLRSPK